MTTTRARDSRSEETHTGWRWDGYFWTAACGRRATGNIANSCPAEKQVTCGLCMRALADKKKVKA